MRLNEEDVMRVIALGVHLKTGRLYLTPIRRAQCLPVEYMVDCDHFKCRCSQHSKTSKEAAAKFCMIRNVLYPNGDC